MVRGESYFLMENESGSHRDTRSLEKTSTPLRIFLSYGRDRNEPLVRRIKTDLERRGHDVWFDKHRIKSGDDWRRSITDGILDSTHVLSFLSKHSTRDPGVCLDEIRIAIVAKGGNIQTILVESESDVQTPSTISHIQWLDMHNWEEMYNSGGEQWDTWYSEKLGQIIRVLESDTNLRFAGEIQSLEAYLKPVSSDSRISQLLNKEFVGRLWLIEAIEKWRNERDSVSRLLWIVGAPGVGKSAFAAHLAHYGRDTVIAVQFCEYDKPDHRDANRVVRTLAFQIATRLPDYRKFLLTLPELKDLDRKNSSELFDYLLVTPLHHLIVGGREQYFIVIDALDEAGENGRNELVDVLAKNAPRLPDWISIIATSRPEFDVISPFQGLHPIVMSTQTESNLSDIRVYIERELAPFLAEIQNREEIVEHILDESEGVFLYVECMCDDIRRGNISVQDYTRFPRGLGSYFFHYFQRFVHDIETFRKTIRPALRVIIAAREPLPLEILQRIFDWEDEELMDVAQNLGSLFPISLENGTRVIKPYHKSLADWLTDDERSGMYYISEKEGHRILSDFSLNEYSQGVDHVSRYSKFHLAAHLSLSGRWNELQSYLLDTRIPFLPAWIEVNSFPDNWDLRPMQSRITALNDEIWNRYRYGRPDNLEDLLEIFTLFEKIISRRTSQWFFDIVAANMRLPDFFQSPFSDICCGLHVNTAKIHIYDKIKKTIFLLEEIGIRIPYAVSNFRCRLQKSCLYCDGSYLLDTSNLIDELAFNRGLVFRGDWENDDPHFNTVSLITEAISKNGNISLVEKLIEGGANSGYTYCGKPLSECAREQGNIEIAELLECRR